MNLYQHVSDVLSQEGRQTRVVNFLYGELSFRQGICGGNQQLGYWFSCILCLSKVLCALLHNTMLKNTLLHNTLLKKTPKPKSLVAYPELSSKIHIWAPQ